MSSFNGTNTVVTGSDESGVVATLTIPGIVQFAGAVSDDNGGTENIVTGTQPFFSSNPYLVLDARSTNDIGRGTGERIVIGATSIRPNGYQATTVSAHS